MKELEDGCDMITVCIMSHGEDRDTFLTSDLLTTDIYHLVDLINLNSPQFREVPKWIIVNACQGNRHDYGTSLANSTYKTEYGSFSLSTIFNNFTK